VTRGRERGGGRIAGAAGAQVGSERERGGGAGAESGRVEVVVAAVAGLFVGTVVVWHDAFHSFLVLIIQRGVGQNWVYPKRKLFRTYTELIDDLSERRGEPDCCLTLFPDHSSDSGAASPRDFEKCQREAT
jgi:hypothetical protein